MSEHWRCSCSCYRSRQTIVFFHRFSLHYVKFDHSALPSSVSFFSSLALLCIVRSVWIVCMQPLSHLHFDTFEAILLWSANIYSPVNAFPFNQWALESQPTNQPILYMHIARAHNAMHAVWVHTDLICLCVWMHLMLPSSLLLLISNGSDLKYANGVKNGEIIHKTIFERTIFNFFLFFRSFDSIKTEPNRYSKSFLGKHSYRYS